MPEIPRVENTRPGEKNSILYLSGYVLGKILDLGKRGGKEPSKHDERSQKENPKRRRGSDFRTEGARSDHGRLKQISIVSDGTIYGGFSERDRFRILCTGGT